MLDELQNHQNITMVPIVKTSVLNAGKKVIEQLSAKITYSVYNADHRKDHAN